MFQGLCENCGGHSTTRCSECINKFGITSPSNLGMFCSKECQKACNISHKAIHKAILKASKDFNNRGINETIAISLKEGSIKGYKPDLFDNNILNIIMIGASDTMENVIEYNKLVLNLKTILYPELKSVNITMCGPRISHRPLQQFESNDETCYTVTTQNGLFEVLYPDPSVVKSKFSFGIILHPGFSDYLLSWKPAMDILVASDILVLTTGYSNYDRFTRDALYENLISEYYGANVVLGPTFNKASCLAIAHRGIVPHAYYSIFKSRSNDVVLLSYEEAVYKSRQIFLRYVGDESIKYEGNPIFGESCIRMADDLASKKLEIPLNKSLSEIEKLAHNYNYQPIGRHGVDVSVDGFGISFKKSQKSDNVNDDDTENYMDSLGLDEDFKNEFKNLASALKKRRERDIEKLRERE